MYSSFLSRTTYTLFLGFVFYCLSSCGIYSFTGTSISPDIKTISIRNYTNETGLGPAILSQNFTEKLKEYFLQNSNLKLVKTNGDLQLEGSIISYALGPVGAQQGTNQFQTGQQNRLTIRVRTKFTNTKDESLNYEKEFSFYDDFTLNQSLSTVENQKVETITDQIVLDIFNASVANW
ncbi:MAG TPA: hypothetical protein DCR46_02620 [Cytophagales bacterium]|nr:hypothetical protein [Cytophagales bacterium]